LDSDDLESRNQLGPATATLQARTGRGGLHEYFIWPFGSEVKNSAGKLIKGVDVRGKGGFVVAPPSLHANGNRYEWIDPEAEIQKAPDWLLALVTGEKPKKEINPEQVKRALASIPPDQRLRRAINYTEKIGFAAREGQGGDAKTWTVAHAGYLFGVEKETWFGWLRNNWNPACKPPWELHDLHTKIENGYRYPLDGPPFGWKLAEGVEFEAFEVVEDEDGIPIMIYSKTDTDHALAIVEDVKERGCLLWAVKGDLVYFDGLCWQSIGGREAQRFVIDTLHRRAAIVEGKPAELLLGRTKVKAIADSLYDVAEKKTLSEYAATRKAGGIGTRDGVFYVNPSGELEIHPHTPELAGAQFFDLSLKDSDPTPRAFVGFLERLFAGPESEIKIEFLREFLGAAMTGLAVEFDTFLILYGEGSNGKSTLLNIIQRLCFDPSLIQHITPHAMEKDFTFIALRDALLNVAGELPARSLQNSERFKQAVSGDEASDRQIQRDIVTFKARAAHVFAANTLPNVKDTSDGFWRRAAVLVFDNKFHGDEKREVLNDQFDQERASVIRWCLQGLINLRRRGRFVLPDSSILTQQEWKNEADPVTSFVDDAVDLEAEGFTTKATLYNAFRNWYDAYSGGRATKHNQHSFSRKVKGLLGDAYDKRTAKQRGWNLKVKDPSAWGVKDG
jgi:P4 family phage/plasmid primase-like protien